jgi:O-methyltransferase involved in polyketide biosynthesis
MSQNIENDLSGMAETLFLPLYVRAMEAKRPDAILKDERAIALIDQLKPDPSWLTKMKVDEDDKAALVLRNREFDRYARDYMVRSPEAVIVHIGCGLDSRFERVDNGLVEWYDLDLPEVIQLRRKLVGGEGERYHLLGNSALDPVWMDVVGVHLPRPFLFLAEGVFMYFEEAQVKALVLALLDHFPGAELVFDAFSPFLVRLNNLRIARTKIGARYHWGLKHSKELEKWGDGICLLDEWHFLDHAEPRLAHHRWLRHIPPLAKSSGIYHYWLGEKTKLSS